MNHTLNFQKTPANANEPSVRWVAFPYENDGQNPILQGKYLYAVGGFHSMDNGCPDWGGCHIPDLRSIGDHVGNLIVTYSDETETRIPLVFGYTLWYHNIWAEDPVLADSEEENTKLKSLLYETLHVRGAYDKQEQGVLKIELKDAPIFGIRVESANSKVGIPIYLGGYVADSGSEIMSGGALEVDASDRFFNAHTVLQGNEFPQKHRGAIETLCRALYTYDDDFDNAPERFIYPDEPTGYRLHFGGSKLAEIASGNVYHNMKCLSGRVDPDGRINGSYLGAPNWRHNGFGPFLPHMGGFHGLFYSRDGGHTILTLNAYGHTKEAGNACTFANEYLMHFPRNKLTLGGVPVPGHFTVMINNPMVYSTHLTKLGWPTRYTEERFGADYEGLGNQETDGHGLMMLAYYNVWCNTGKSRAWVEKNKTVLYETARWILWCFEHPELSFAKDGLLYAESEGGLMEYTLSCNVPCYVGLLGYAEMADCIGDTETADAWRACAKVLHDGIVQHLTQGDKWDLTRLGFKQHDPIPSMFADLYGYDPSDMPRDWIERSYATYDDDVRAIREDGYIGGEFIGYNHSMMTQNALLLDMTEDAGYLIESLAKISYAPRLPEPYMVPEAVGYDKERGFFRRLGDLGNLVQQAEAMTCYLMVAGVSPLKERSLKILPRLPKGWSLDLQNFKIQNTEILVDVTTAYPVNGKQSASVHLHGDIGTLTLQFRYGPFAAEDVPELYLNDKCVHGEKFRSGDAYWVYVCVPASEYVE